MTQHFTYVKDCSACGNTFETAFWSKRFCTAKCRTDNWMANHPRKHLKPKRIRSRERDRLYTIIHRGESLAYLREQALDAARVQALRAVEQP